MAADYDRESGGLRLKVQLRQVVQHINGNATGFEHLSFRQLLRPWSFVDIPAHGGDGSNCGKPFEYLGGAGVPGVNDVLRSPQTLDRLRAE